MNRIEAHFAASPLRRECDGVTDDLLTAGLGIAGLRGPTPPCANPSRPTVDELRRRAVHTAYRGVVDVSEGGGFGRLFGLPAVIAGVEYVVPVETPDRAAVNTLVLQIPSAFDPSDPRLVVAASSGSRGAYAALPTVGDWALRQGYAVAYVDKGTGVGVWDLERATGYRIDGLRTDDPEDPYLGWCPPASVRRAAQVPGQHALLFKHVHSGRNPEREWGLYLLQSIVAASRLLTEEYPRARAKLSPGRLWVVAAGVSNGGASVLRAIEADRAGWIAGGVAVEPSIALYGQTADIGIACGQRVIPGRDLAPADWAALHGVLQPAAVLAESDARAPFASVTEATRPRLEAWVQRLQAYGLLPVGDVDAAARIARARLLDAAMLPDALALGHFNVAANLWTTFSVAYAGAYSRRDPLDPYAGVFAAARDAGGQPRPLSDTEAALFWSDGNGIAPTGPVALFQAVDGQCVDVSSGTVDLSLAHASDHQWAGAERHGFKPPHDRDAWWTALRAGQEDVVMSGRLGNRPVIVLHGRADSLIPVNHTSRAYVALNERRRGHGDELVYWEVEHGQHFDASLGDPGFASRYVPLQPWLLESLDRLRDRLERGVPLPPSQVIRSRPRFGNGADIPPLERHHLGALQSFPGDDAIRVERGVINVPD
jgi:hydroxybutyrate-dimer hydrolase